ncbi:MAG: hypothetical protein EXR90_06695 [Methyloglobulus sp.]|nr:hypothetical protein [Methyloglobulus sp.]
MNLDNKFSALQLALINDQGILYACACPVHVSLQINNLRKLFDYQKECMKVDISPEDSVQMQVHRRIAEVTKQAHQLMEQCLEEVLELEGWDKTKLEMPAGPRKRIEEN